MFVLPLLLIFGAVGVLVQVTGLADDLSHIGPVLHRFHVEKQRGWIAAVALTGENIAIHLEDDAILVDAEGRPLEHALHFVAFIAVADRGAGPVAEHIGIEVLLADLEFSFPEKEQRALDDGEEGFSQLSDMLVIDLIVFGEGILAEIGVASQQT